MPRIDLVLQLHNLNRYILCCTKSLMYFTTGVLLLYVFQIYTPSMSYAAPHQEDQRETSSKQTKSKARTWAMSIVHINSDIKGAMVWIDARRIGKIPLPGPWTVPAGRHVIKVAQGKWSKVTTLNMKAGRVYKADLYQQEHPIEEPPEVKIKVKTLHPGAGFKLPTAGYLLISTGLATLGYAVYEHLDAQSLRDTSHSLDDDKDQKKRLAIMNDVDTQILRSRIAYGLAGLSIISGIAYTLWGRGGLLEPQRRAQNLRSKSSSGYWTRHLRWHLDATPQHALIRGEIAW